jgi:hypothetical protein
MVEWNLNIFINGEQLLPRQKNSQLDKIAVPKNQQKNNTIFETKRTYFNTKWFFGDCW